MDAAQPDQRPDRERPHRDQPPLGVRRALAPRDRADHEDRPRQRVHDQPQALESRQQAAPEDPAAVVTDHCVAHERGGVGGEVRAVPRQQQHREDAEAEPGPKPARPRPAVGRGDRRDAGAEPNQAHRSLAHDGGGGARVEARERDGGEAGASRDDQAVESPPRPRRQHHVRLAVVTDGEEPECGGQRERRDGPRRESPRADSDREHRGDRRDRRQHGRQRRRPLRHFAAGE